MPFGENVLESGVQPGLIIQTHKPPPPLAKVPAGI
jgi:hypothetical protein